MLLSFIVLLGLVRCFLFIHGRKSGGFLHLSAFAEHFHCSQREMLSLLLTDAA